MSTKNKKWKTAQGRWRVPYPLYFLSNIPTSKSLRKWYFRKSFEWWNPPSNHHWKLFTLDCLCHLGEDERCLWCGGYCQSKNQEEK